MERTHGSERDGAVARYVQQGPTATRERPVRARPVANVIGDPRALSRAIYDADYDLRQTRAVAAGT